MSNWKSSKAKKVLKALEKIGWEVKRQKGSHKVLAREGWENYVFYISQQRRDRFKNVSEN